VVLLAFVDGATPLGPLPPEVTIRLKKSETYASLSGCARPRWRRARPGDEGEERERGSWAAKHFADWVQRRLQAALPGQPPHPAPLEEARADVPEQ